MKGLELAEKYFNEVGLPMLKSRFAYLCDEITVGLAGQGSECFGFDDEISRDHDWGPSFCIWLSPVLYEKNAIELQKAYDGMQKDFCGFSARQITPEGQGRCGVLNAEQFYYRFIGNTGAPEKLTDWFRAPESAFACTTNGKIFLSSDTAFEKARAVLSKGFPEDIKLKKLAARVVTMAQSGQYNYGRCLKRGNTTAAFLALSEFIKAAVSAVHLLNNAYTPFYKWAFKSMETLENQSMRCEMDAKDIEEMALLIKSLAENPFAEDSSDKIEKICVMIKKELQKKNLTQLDEDFLEVHGVALMQRINDKRIAGLPVMFDV